MKRFLIFLFCCNTLYSVSIGNININGDVVSKKSTILFFSPELKDKKSFSDEELDNILSNWKRRLERTGWYRNIRIEKVVHEDTNEVDITITFSEKIPYTLYFKNNYIGIGKYNIWGEGKELYFEAGFSHKSIRIIDKIFNGGPYFYEFYAGSEVFEYNKSILEKETLLRQRGYGKIGNNIFPDNQISTTVSLEWFQSTNGVETYKNINSFALNWIYDITKGYPVIKEGLRLETFLKIYKDFDFCFDVDLRGYFKVFETIVLANRLHFGISFPELPVYHKYNLKNINGVRTLSLLDGLSGNNVWDFHSELRWAFWDVVPFLLYDLQLEALAFFDIGEARDKFNEFSTPHIVYGCGLRIYLDTFAIRTEIGVDETSKVSVLSSFELPF